LSVVWHWKTRERRTSWIALLAAHAGALFALHTRQQDGDAEESDPSAPSGQSTVPSAQGANRTTAPSGGQDSAFDAFFIQYERPLYGYLRRMLPSHDAALDVAQEAFFRAWQRFDVIGGYDRPQAWLFRVATNLALDLIQRRQPTGLSQLAGHHDDAVNEKSAADDFLPVLMDPFDMERSLAERDLVNRLLGRLPARQRAAVLLWAAYGLTTTEIAEIFATTEVNVRQMLSRGRARFRELYEVAQRSS
jgi:RNA polymerase sigma-70 factor (ECF subfamily)